MPFRLFATAVLALGLLSGVAGAQGMPPASDWTGFYLGAQGGFGFGDSRHQNAVASFDSGWFDVDGALGGGTAGVNWQNGSFVLGLEGDISVSGIDGSTPGTVGLCATRCYTDLNWLGTVRGRIGYAWGPILPYVTGGLAVGELEAGDGGFHGAATRAGWTIGAGGEFSFAPNWSAKAEYLYVDLGKDHIYDFAGAPDEPSFNTSIVRFGVNYRFGGLIR